MSSIKQQILEAIRPHEFYSEQFPDWNGQSLVQCPFHQDVNNSLSVNADTGAYFCHGCGRKGTSVIGFHTDANCSGDFREALRSLFSRYVSPLFSEKVIMRYHERLLESDKLLTALMAVRGWTTPTAVKLRLGWSWSAKRVVIPIYNLRDFAIDVRLHDSLYRAPLKGGKRRGMLARREIPNGSWFPISGNRNPFAVVQREIWCVEGEPDAITLVQHGFNVVTLTGGARSWEKLSSSQLKQFEGKDVLFCRHDDEAGKKCSEVFSTLVASVDITSLRVFTPPRAKDLNDYFAKSYGTPADLRAHAYNSAYVLPPRKAPVGWMPLAATSKPEFFGSWLQTDVLVNGKHHSPLAIPKVVVFSCVTSAFCSSCPCQETGSARYSITRDDPKMVLWLKESRHRYESIIKNELRIPKECKLSLRVDEYQNLESCTVIPALSNSSSIDNSYVTRQAYSLTDIEANQQYKITAKPLHDPSTKESVLLIEKIEGTKDNIKSFRLEQEEVTQLCSIFTDPPLKTISDICEMLADNHTKIYGRPDLHTAVELVYHSPRDLVFGGTRLPKGSLEALIFGDTRCGKGQVAEGLVKFYDLGVVISGENASFAGLCGGLTKVNDSFFLSWGAIPLNHGRLVVIDEFSGLQEDILGRLSRVRSEGVAELTKVGVQSRTNANARLLWIANPRKGRDVGSFSSGVQAILDLVRTNEDVARFDFACVVAKGEVDIDQINVRKATSRDSRYTRDVLRKVLMWTWSLEASQICFTPRAEKSILTASMLMAQRYSSTIPLVQGENIRFKLAKTSAAIAARCFSVGSEDGSQLLVQQKHAEAAVHLMQLFYDKPSMGYLTYSQLEQTGKTIRNKKKLRVFFESFPDAERMILVNGLLQMDEFTVSEMQDWCNTDVHIAKKHLSMLVHSRAVRQKGSRIYAKQPAFTTLLRRMKE